MTTLPRSLQALIEEARNVQSSVESSVSEEDGIADELLDELRRGEYSQELYWSCVADDAEEAADWEAAKSACNRILALDDVTCFDRVKAHLRVADLLSLQGDDELALQEYQQATSEAKGDETEVIYRTAIVREAWSLVRLEKLKAAKQLVEDGLVSESIDDDSLGAANLLVIKAVCELAVGRLKHSRKTLEAAWQHLECLRSSLEEHGVFDDASGVHSAYASWWRVQAEHFRAAKDSNGEINALSHSLAQARSVASQLSGPFADARVARLLLATADAYERANRIDEANANRKEAQDIAANRGLRDAAIAPSLVPSRATLVGRKYFWNR